MKAHDDLCTRLTITTAALVLALASTLLFNPAAQADVLSHYQPHALVKAERALEQGDPDLALQYLHRQRAILGHERYAAASASITCRALFQKQDFGAAEAACNTAVERGNYEAMWSHLNNRGAVRLMLGKYDEALVDLRRASRLNPASRDASRNLRLAKRLQRQQAGEAELQQVSMI